MSLWNVRRGIGLLAGLAGIALIAACTTMPGPSGGGGTAGGSEGRPPIVVEPVTPGDVPPHMQGRSPVRVALLLPTSSQNAELRQVARSLLDAAQLAVFEVNNPDLLLIPKDTGGTAAGAEAAAREAIREGAEVILGPVLREEVTAIKPISEAQNIPVIAFSTDRSVAGRTVHLLSFQPEQEVERVIAFAVSKGRFNFAGLIPVSDYGGRVRDALQVSVGARGARLVALQPYPRDAAQMMEPVKALAEYQKSVLRGITGASRGAPITTGTVQSQVEIAQNYQALGSQPFDAVLLPEGGTLLRALAPLLPYYDVDPGQVKFLGTGLWDDPVVSREPALVGGWFAAPPPEARNAFITKFERAYGRKPPRIASLSFDAVALAGALGRLPKSQRFSTATLTNPNGFSGIDGVFRFNADGSTDRGLAVLEVKPEGFVVVGPAPTTFEGFRGY